jgi:hypothetical protein
MDFFLATCQALGIALAVGALIGAVVPRGENPAFLVWGAAAVAAAAGALSMSADDQTIVAGIVAGAIGGWLGARVISALVLGAARRAQGGPGSIALIVSVAALVLAGLSILLPPVSLVALLAVGWLGIARRRRAERKYEGLRILR